MLAVHPTINLLMKGLGQVGVGWGWVGVGRPVLLSRGPQGSAVGPKTSFTWNDRDV